MSKFTTAPEQTQATPLAILYQRGARFVLCQPNKRPLWKRWQKRRPPVEVCHYHIADEGLIGIVPYSIQSSAVDIDEGNPSEFFSLYPPIVAVESKRSGGWHGYYADKVGRSNQRFEFQQWRGDLRSARGFLILHSLSAQQLLAQADFAIDSELPGWLPDNLFEAAGVELEAQQTKPYQPTPDAQQHWQQRAAAAWSGLPRIEPGNRNNSLFDTVRFFAYAEPKPAQYAPWQALVDQYSLDANGQFPAPLDEREVLSTARSIGSWTYSGGGPIDHSPTAQQRRGRKSGQKRRAKTRERDEWIARLSAEGKKQREIALLVGLSDRQVRTILKRKSGSEPNQLGGEEAPTRPEIAELAKAARWSEIPEPNQLGEDWQPFPSNRYPGLYVRVLDQYAGYDSPAEPPAGCKKIEFDTGIAYPDGQPLILGGDYRVEHGVTVRGAIQRTARASGREDLAERLPVIMGGLSAAEEDQQQRRSKHVVKASQPQSSNTPPPTAAKNSSKVAQSDLFDGLPRHGFH